jgi:hypothetical protein
MNGEDIELIYVPIDPEPAAVRSTNSIITIVLEAIIQGAIDAGKQALKETAQMFTMERLTGVLTEHIREMAGTWVSKTLIDGSQAEWLGNLLHAFGLDSTDLLRVGNNAVERFSISLNENLLTGLNQIGLQNDAVAGIWRVGLEDHKAGISDAMMKASLLTGMEISKFSSVWQYTNEDATKLTITNANRQEEYNRLHLSSLFQETPEKIAARAKIGSEQTFDVNGNLIDDKIDKELPKIVQTIGKKLDPIKEFLINQTEIIAKSVMHVVTSKIPVTPESGYANGITAFGMAASFGIAAHSICTAAELVHPIKTMGFNYIAAYLVDIANFAPIAKAGWGQYVDYAIKVPTSYAIRRELRPIIPDVRDVTEIAIKGEINIDDYRRVLSYNGYSDGWIKAMEKIMFRELTVREMSTVMEDTNITPSWVYKKMRLRGYDSDDAQKLTSGMFDKYLKTYNNDYKSKLMDLYGSGYIREQMFDSFVAPLNLRPEAVALMKKSSDLKFIHDYIKESIIMFLDQFDKDLIDESDLEVSLSALGLESKRLKLLLNRAINKKAGKVAAAENTQIKSLIRQKQNLIIKQYSQAFEQGYIDEDELYKYLIDAGLDISIVEIIVNIETGKTVTMATKKELQTVESETTKIQAIYEQGYIDLFRKDLIDETGLKERLLSINRDQEYIDALIEKETIKKIKPEVLFQPVS